MGRKGYLIPNDVLNRDTAGVLRNSHALHRRCVSICGQDLNLASLNFAVYKNLVAPTTDLKPPVPTFYFTKKDFGHLTARQHYFYFLLFVRFNHLHLNKLLFKNSFVKSKIWQKHLLLV
jgi:hypothetical protein